MRQAISVVGLSAVALLVSARGITSESAVSLEGDMPRYLMNGVYFLDVLRDRPFTHLIDYTREYFARYPALSLGHHPIVPAVAEIPFYWLFGVSVFAGRAMTATFLIVAVIAWFLLIQRMYDARTAQLASLLLLTSPAIVLASQTVMSEIPALALIIVSVYWLRRFCETEAPRHAAGFVCAAVLSVYAKHFAVFMLPVYLAYLVHVKGWRRLLVKDVLWSSFIIVLLILPLVPLTLKLARFNITVLTEWAPEEAGSAFRISNLLFYVNALWKGQMSLPLVILAFLSIVGSLVRRDRRAVLFLLWIALFYLQMTALGWGEPRFAIYWVPAFCLFGASAFSLFELRSWRVAMTAASVLIIGYQSVLAAAIRPVGAAGYEEAARFVIDHPKGDTVLFSASVDSGYFVFFVRKHDPNRQLVVLRADKILTTSRLMELNFSDRISRPEEIEQILRDYGVAYVVIEETEYPPGPLQWLQEQAHSERFMMRRRIPLESRDPRLRGVSLSVYEYRSYTPADPSAILSMNIPLIGESVEIPLRKLLGTKQGRQ